MSQMFCTLKHAADKLETTETEIEAMLKDGVLREFRDGSKRLLKVADLADMAVAAHPANASGHTARTQRRVRSSQPELDYNAFTLPELEIKLPPSATVTARAPSPRATAARCSPRPVPNSADRKRVAPSAVARKPVAAQRRQSPPCAVVISPATAPRPRPRTYEMSLRQWLWMGLLDDSPFAILLLFGTILLGIGAAAGAAYLVVRFL